jgi:hypothetical protein
MTEANKDAIAKVEPVKTGVLAVVPDYLKDDEREGLETITRKDMTIPRLALAQALSPQVTEGDPNLIEGLKPGDLFNPVTKQNYGQKVEFQVVHKDRPRAMHYRSIDEGGGVIDPDVPLNSPLLKWGTTGDKKKDKPVATLFYDYVAVLLPSRELIALSFKSSGIKCAKALAGLIAFRNKSMYAGKYVITTGTEQKPKPHKIYLVDNAGWVSEEDYVLGKQMYETLKNLDTVSMIDRADPDAFDADELERQAIQAEGAVVEAGTDVGKM